MRIVSVHVGQPREVPHEGGMVLTSIFKAPVAGPVRVLALNLMGDRQSDLSVHGGREKAVYAYPSEHYPRWRAELGMEIPFGMFGENLTMEGLLEGDVRIGDRLRAGTAEFVVTQPRVPCFKLGIRFGRADIIRRFVESGRSGFYLSVAREGTVAAGEPLGFVAREAAGMTVVEIARLRTDATASPELLRRATELEALPEGWREGFRKRL